MPLLFLTFYGDTSSDGAACAVADKNIEAEEMVFITHIRLAPLGHAHEHITHVKWRDPANGQEDMSTVAVMIEWIEKQNGIARVTDGQRTATVAVVRGGARPYLRTHADGVWTDNLLALPRF